jgi:hypothetical protein
MLDCLVEDPCDDAALVSLPESSIEIGIVGADSSIESSSIDSIM